MDLNATIVQLQAEYDRQCAEHQRLQSREAAVVENEIRLQTIEDVLRQRDQMILECDKSLQQRDRALTLREKKLFEQPLRNDKRQNELASWESSIAEREAAVRERERMGPKITEPYSKRSSEIIQEDDFSVTLGKKTYKKPSMEDEPGGCGQQCNERR